MSLPPCTTLILQPSDRVILPSCVCRGRVLHEPGSFAVCVLCVTYGERLYSDGIVNLETYITVNSLAKAAVITHCTHMRLCVYLHICTVQCSTFVFFSITATETLTMHETEGPVYGMYV